MSFDISPGEIVGYIGSNGAGKSTTIKMMTGILTPTIGRCLVNGIVPYEKRMENSQNIGVVFGQRTQLWWDLPLSETYTILRDIYRVPNNAIFNLSNEDVNWSIKDQKIVLNYHKEKISSMQIISCTMDKLDINDINIRELPIEDIV